MKIKSPHDIIAGYIALFLSILIFSFTTFKAWHISFTIDESASYLFYVHDSYRHIIECTRLEANNHILNSVLMKFLSSWLPLSELTLRLPNLFANIVFLFATWHLISDFKNAWFRLGIFLFINLNPYLLDFFSLARGYAISWALMTLSLYFLKRFIEYPGRKFVNLACCFVMAGLGVIASFPLLDFYLALLCVYLAYEFINIRPILNNSYQVRACIFRIVFSVFISIVVLSYVLRISYMLLDSNLLYFGGDTGFWADTVHSLIVSALYGASYSTIAIYIVTGFVMLIFIAGVFALATPFFFAKYKTRVHPFFYLLVSVLFLVVIGTIAQHYILGTKFLIQRAAGYILVLFFLTSAYLINFYITDKLRLYFAILIGGISVYHFIETCNTNSVYDWKLDSETKKMMMDFGIYHNSERSRADSLISFNAYKKNAAACLFYQELYKYNWMLPVNYSDHVNHTEDFYYLQDDSLYILKGFSYQVIGHYPDVKESLIQNIQKIKNNSYGKSTISLYDTVLQDNKLRESFPLITKHQTNCVLIKTGAYSPFTALNASVLKNKTGLNVLASAHVFFPDGRSGGLNVAIYDKKGKILKWNSMDFGDYYLQDSGWMTIPFKLEIYESYPDADSLRVFIWNTGKHPILASELKVFISQF